MGGGGGAGPRESFVEGGQLPISPRARCSCPLSEGVITKQTNRKRNREVSLFALTLLVAPPPKAPHPHSHTLRLLPKMRDEIIIIYLAG